MKLFVATLWNEANAFAPFLTELEHFTRYAPGELPDDMGEVEAVTLEARRRAGAGAFELVEGSFAYAEPSGLVSEAAFEHLAAELVRQFQESGPFDMVALALHGAMATPDVDDCEGVLLSRLRRAAGANQPAIGILLDPHASLSTAMLRQAEIIVAMKEYPHVDFRERATELFDLLIAARLGEIHPVRRAVDTGMIGIFSTMGQAGRRLVDAMTRMEALPDILSVSLIHGFPWSDGYASGTRSLVISNGNPSAAEHAAWQLSDLAREIAPECQPRPIALDTALAESLAREGVSVWADSPDNPGGGAAGDSTYVAKFLMERKVTPACVGPIWDPQAVEDAFGAGVGARLPVRIGGKAGAYSGSPLTGEGEILALDEDGSQTFSGANVPMGRVAAVRLRGVDLVVASKRIQALGPDLFTRLGIDPEKCSVVAVKSSRHFEAGFARIADQVHILDVPGSLQSNLAQYPYRHMTRPRWPLDSLPAAQLVTDHKEDAPL